MWDGDSVAAGDCECTIFGEFGEDGDERAIEWKGKCTAGMWYHGGSIYLYVDTSVGNISCPSCGVYWPLKFGNGINPPDVLHGKWSISAQDIEELLDWLTIEVPLDSSVLAQVTPGPEFSQHDCKLPLPLRPFKATVTWIDKTPVVRELQEVYRFARTNEFAKLKTSIYYDLAYRDPKA
jgi:hypothetical protein